MLAKICPRCGAQYENMRSTTCPQCFAKLLVIDEATAEELSAARAQVEQTPEFQEAKAEDDERFREQSFGACVGVVAIFLMTVIAVIILLVHAMHRQRTVERPLTNIAAPIVGTRSLTVLPVAAASIDDVLPPTVGPYVRRSRDQDVNLPGTLTRIFHAQYGPKSDPLDAYAVPADRPTPELNTFGLGVTLAAGTGGAQKATVFFATEHWRFAILAPVGASPDTFHQQLIAQFAARSH